MRKEGARKKRGAGGRREGGRPGNRNGCVGWVCSGKGLQ